MELVARRERARAVAWGSRRLSEVPVHGGFVGVDPFHLTPEKVPEET
jgi:hypothetical protein